MTHDVISDSDEVYEVQPGDSVGKICRKFYADSSYFNLLADYNKLASASSINVGQALSIPPISTLLALSNDGEYTYISLTAPELANAFGIKESDEKGLANIALFLPAINELCPQFGICGPRRQAHFLSQIGHESALFAATEENLNYSEDALLRVFSAYVDEQEAKDLARKPEAIANKVYANRIGNGDSASKDGWNFRGRGLIQLTGRSNYHAFNLAFQDCSTDAPDLIENPDTVCTDPNAAVFSAVWFWTIKQLNKTADNENVETVTKIVNGGDNGLAHRQALFDALYNCLSTK